MRKEDFTRNCNQCMLSGNKHIELNYIPDSKICFISGIPSKEEVLDGEILSGSIGYTFNMHLAHLRLNRINVSVMSVIGCYIDEKNYKSIEFENALENCGELFNKFLVYLFEQGVKVLVPMDTVAMQALGLDVSITVGRGSVYVKHGFTIIPMHDPKFLRRKNVETVTALNDLKKIKYYSENPYATVDEDFNIFPSLKDVKNFTVKAINKNSLVALDIETTSLSPDKGDIFVMGLAVNGTECIVIPFYKQGNEKYWSFQEEKEIKELLQNLFNNCSLLIQNGMYDAYWLLAKGYKNINVVEDTMILHHLIHPELPHDLEYIVSIYGETPAWKNKYSSHKIPIGSKEDSLVRTYNARDTVVLHQSLENLKKDGQDILKLYKEISIPLIKPLLEMQLSGLKVDKKRLREWRKELLQEINEYESEMREVCDLPKEFNINSVQQLQFLLYGLYPEWYKTKCIEYKNWKKAKNTKLYTTLQEKVLLFSKILPFEIPKGFYPAKIKSGFSTNNEALVRYLEAINKRKIVIKNLKKLTEYQIDEKLYLERASIFIIALIKYRAVCKLESTYTRYSVSKDGKVRGQFKITGTNTGRLSSANPNLQNIPSVGKKIFVPDEEDEVFIDCDYTNLELVILAYEAEDEVLQEVFLKGENVHDINTKILFRIDKHSSNWSMYRKIAKIYIFSRNYGGTLRSIFKKIKLKVPEFPYTYSEFVRMDTRYFNAHPKQKIWRKRIENSLLFGKEKQLVTAFGRKRIFLGRKNDILREGLNTPIQGTAADITNTALINIYRHRANTKPFTLKITVHDSIVVTAKAKHAVEVAKYKLDMMEKSVTIKGKTVHCKGIAKIGYNYKECVDLEVWEALKENITKKDIALYLKLCEDQNFMVLSIEDRIKKMKEVKCRK